MKIFIKSIPALLLGVCSMSAAAQGMPVYLDETKPIEERVEDALKRMTLDEKIAVIHAQSKFSSPGVKRLGIPEFWTDDGPHGVRPTCCGTNGSRQARPTTRAWHFRR